MDKFDAVVIGSGLGGLLSALLMSKEGMNVCVLEKNEQFGGLLQNFTRGGINFETGVHYVGSLGEGEVLNQYFKYFGIIDKLKFKQLDREHFDIIRFKDNEYGLPNGYDAFEDSLLRTFPEEADGIRKYITRLHKECDSHEMYNLNVPSQNFIENQIVSTDAWEFISSVIKDDTLKNVLFGNNILYAGQSERTPLIMHALVLNSYIQSAWRFVGGSGQIADAIMNEIKSQGGTLRNLSKVAKINVKDNKAYSVELESGEKINAEYFIAAIHPSLVIELIEGTALSKPYQKRISNLENTISVFSAYLTLKEKSQIYRNYNYYSYMADNVDIIHNYQSGEYPGMYLMMQQPDQKNPGFAESVTLMTYMSYDDVSRWENSSIGKRGEAYKEFKKRWANILIDKVEADFPGFRNSVKNIYTSTPLTIRDYTGTPKGSLYGILKDSKNPYGSHLSHRTKISNLYLTGQNINTHGVIGVTISSVLSCSDIFDLSYLMKKVRDA